MINRKLSKVTANVHLIYLKLTYRKLLEVVVKVHLPYVNPNPIPFFCRLMNFIKILTDFLTKPIHKKILQSTIELLKIIHSVEELFVTVADDIVKFHLI